MIPRRTGPGLDPARRPEIAQVREAFLRAGYTASGVSELLGPVASAALGRDQTVPARQKTSDGSPLATLVRLFLLQLTVDGGLAAEALPLTPARGLGLVETSGSEVRAVLDIRPYAEQQGEDPDSGWWVASDLGTGLDGVISPLPEEHVLGVGGASTTLAQITVRAPVTRALDIGTGCGVQALHASRHCAEVVGTDVSSRALRMAGLTSALSGVPLELRAGSLLDPVAGEDFDLVVTNPPFVVSRVGTRAAGHHTYRDSGLDLDGVCAHLLARAPSLLRAGGTFQMLGNWVRLRGADWADRVAEWTPPTGFDTLVVQREMQDPAAYVETWLRDAGETGGAGYLSRYDGWLRAFDEAGVEGIGFGYAWVRRTDEAGRLTLLDWPYPIEQPLGPHVQAWFERRQWLVDRDDQALAAGRLRLADDVVQEQLGRPGAEHPEHLVLRQQTGLRRAFPAGTALAALAGACDGTLALGTLIDAVLTLLGDDPAGRSGLLDEVRGLVEAGVLLPG